jgi:hypothetical protein
MQDRCVRVRVCADVIVIAQAERTKGASFASALASEEASSVVIMEKGSEHGAFWEALGDRAVVRSAAEGGDDDEGALCVYVCHRYSRCVSRMHRCTRRPHSGASRDGAASALSCRQHA